MWQSRSNAMLYSQFNCTPVDSWSRLKAIHFSWLRPELFHLLLDPSGLILFYFRFSVMLFDLNIFILGNIYIQTHNTRGVPEIRGKVS